MVWVNALFWLAVRCALNPLAHTCPSSVCLYNTHPHQVSRHERTQLTMFHPPPPLPVSLIWLPPLLLITSTVPRPHMRTWCRQGPVIFLGRRLIRQLIWKWFTEPIRKLTPLIRASWWQRRAKVRQRIISDHLRRCQTSSKPPGLLSKCFCRWHIKVSEVHNNQNQNQNHHNNHMNPPDIGLKLPQCCFDIKWAVDTECNTVCPQKLCGGNSAVRLTPQTAAITQPQNWFLVLWLVSLLVFHLFFHQLVQGGNKQWIALLGKYTRW